EFKEFGKNNIQYRFVSPEEQIEGENKSYSDTLVALGAEPINLTIQLKAGQQSQYIFPTALVHYKGKEQLVTLYIPSPIPSKSENIFRQELNTAEDLME